MPRAITIMMLLALVNVVTFKIFLRCAVVRILSLLLLVLVSLSRLLGLFRLIYSILSIAQFLAFIPHRFLLLKLDKPLTSLHCLRNILRILVFLSLLGPRSKAVKKRK